MEKGLVLQERDIKLLEFLAQYKTITLDNTRYIYGTKTYQEKRICNLVKENYVTRLGNREIALGINGRKFLNSIHTEIKEHCRNTNNIERLKVISDIAAFTDFSSTMNFVPSWDSKDRNSPTHDSRRYLGHLNFENECYPVYSVYGDKNDKYITSIYYDLKKEIKDTNTFIFVNNQENFEKILYHKKSFGKGDKHLYLVEYNEFNKRIIRNYNKIKTCMFYDLGSRHKMEHTDFRYTDFLVDDNLYLKIVLFIDLNQLYNLRFYLESCPSYKDKMYFICFEKDEKYLKHIIPNCSAIIIDESTVEEYLEKDFIEIEGKKIDWKSE